MVTCVTEYLFLLQTSGVIEDISIDHDAVISYLTTRLEVCVIKMVSIIARVSFLLLCLQMLPKYLSVNLLDSWTNGIPTPNLAEKVRIETAEGDALFLSLLEVFIEHK